MKQITAISRRYRDQGHQDLGPHPGHVRRSRERRVGGREVQGDRRLEVRTQPFDLPAQWMPQSWDVTATSAGAARS